MLSPTASFFSLSYTEINYDLYIYRIFYLILANADSSYAVDNISTKGCMLSPATSLISSYYFVVNYDWCIIIIYVQNCCFIINLTYQNVLLEYYLYGRLFTCK